MDEILAKICCDYKLCGGYGLWSPCVSKFKCQQGEADLGVEALLATANTGE